MGNETDPEKHRNGHLSHSVDSADKSYGDVSAVPDIDHQAEARLIRKLDLMIVPPVMLLYLFSFLDRVNVSLLNFFRLESG